jgi:hypothetical protein
MPLSGAVVRSSRTITASRSVVLSFSVSPVEAVTGRASKVSRFQKLRVLVRVAFLPLLVVVASGHTGPAQGLRKDHNSREIKASCLLIWRP